MTTATTTTTTITDTATVTATAATTATTATTTVLLLLLLLLLLLYYRCCSYLLYYNSYNGHYHFCTRTLVFCGPALHANRRFPWLRAQAPAGSPPTAGAPAGAHHPWLVRITANGWWPRACVYCFCGNGERHKRPNAASACIYKLDKPNYYIPTGCRWLSKYIHKSMLHAT